MWVQILLGEEMSMEMGGRGRQQGKEQGIVMMRVEMKYVEGKKIDGIHASKNSITIFFTH